MPELPNYVISHTSMNDMGLCLTQDALIRSMLLQMRICSEQAPLGKPQAVTAVCGELVTNK